MPTWDYQIIREAILNKHQVIATYGGHRREMCPHVLGTAPDGVPQCLFYQFAGGSDRGLGPDGSPQNWRCIPIPYLRGVVTRPGPWHSASDRVPKQTCVRTVDVQVEYGTPADEGGPPVPSPGTPGEG